MDLSFESIDANVHATKQKQYQGIQRALLLNVVVGEGAAVFQLLAREDEALGTRKRFTCTARHQPPDT